MEIPTPGILRRSFMASCFSMVYLLLQAKQAIHELFLVEYLEVFHLLPYAYVLYRYFKLIGYRKHYPALCCAVELGNGQGRNIGSCRKMFCLFYSILPGAAIKHQQYF